MSFGSTRTTSRRSRTAAWLSTSAPTSTGWARTSTASTPRRLAFSRAVTRCWRCPPDIRRSSWPTTRISSTGPGSPIPGMRGRGTTSSGSRTGSRGIRTATAGSTSGGHTSTDACSCTCRGSGLAAYLADTLAQALRGEAGLELPALTPVAEALAARDTLGWEAAFLRAARHGRPPWSARVEQWREVEAALSDLLDRIVLAQEDPELAVHDAARQLDGLLSAAR